MSLGLFLDLFIIGFVGLGIAMTLHAMIQARRDRDDSAKPWWRRGPDGRWFRSKD